MKPKAEDFKDWAQYETAKDKYDEDLADYKAEQKIQEYEQRQRQSAATQAMQARLDEAKSRYGDEAEPKIMDTAKTVFEDQKIAPAIKTAIGRSQVLVDALYVMGSDPNELASFIDLVLKILSKLSANGTPSKLSSKQNSKSPPASRKPSRKPTGIRPARRRRKVPPCQDRKKGAGPTHRIRWKLISSGRRTGPRRGDRECQGLFGSRESSRHGSVEGLDVTNGGRGNYVNTSWVSLEILRLLVNRLVCTEYFNRTGRRTSTGVRPGILDSN